jgi:heme A synthase
VTDNNVAGKPLDKAPRVPLPAGYRQGIISAITVLLGFSLLFLRYWNFEAEGEWTLASLVATILLALAIVLELVALWRSLQPRDDDEAEYQITLRWFLASIVILLVSLLLAGLIVSHAINF